MDEESSDLMIVKLTADNMPFMQTLRMLSASDKHLISAKESIAKIIDKSEALQKTCSSELVQLISTLQDNERNSSSSSSEQKQQFHAPDDRTVAPSLTNLVRDLNTQIQQNFSTAITTGSDGNSRDWHSSADDAIAIDDLDAAYEFFLSTKLKFNNKEDDAAAVHKALSEKLWQAVIIRWSTPSNAGGSNHSFSHELAQTIRLVAIMKSLGCDSLTLRILYLSCRSEILDRDILHLLPSDNNNNNNNKPTATFFTKFIELHRTFLLETVTLYNSLPLPTTMTGSTAVLSGEDDENVSSLNFSNNNNNNTAKSILYSWLDVRLEKFQILLSHYILLAEGSEAAANDDDDDEIFQQRLENIFSQLMYFGLSISRAYYDRRLELAKIIESALARRVDRVVTSATAEFVERLGVCLQICKTLIWLQVAQQHDNESSNGSTAVLSSEIHSRCRPIFQEFCQRIQHYALNPLRACAMTTLAQHVRRRILNDAVGTTMRAEAAKFARQISDEFSSSSHSTQPTASANFGAAAAVVEMANKVEQHLRTCVDICFPSNELQHEQF